jgi:hypothetical protein
MLRVSPTATAPPSTARPEVPAARRLTRRRWRDPRLWVGLVLVAASVVAGARVLAAADDTVGVWVLARDVVSGAPLTSDALAVRQVRFTDDATAAQYLPASTRVPGGLVLARDVSAGEMLTRDSLTTSRGTAFELPVVVGPGGAPEDLQTGDVVDVWVGPQAGSGESAPARPMLTAVPVVSAARSAGPLGEAATRQVLLGVDEDAPESLGPLLGQMSSGTVVLVRHGAAAPQGTPE